MYNERITDLLPDRARRDEEVVRELFEDPKRGVIVRQQVVKTVSSLEEIMALIEYGNKNRHTAATKMNDRSSRSHAIVQVFLEQSRSLNTGHRIIGLPSKINLVDLAGSERAATAGTSGKQFEHAKFINQSLTTFGRVIDALALRSQGKTGQFTLPPYRDAKLTHLLKDSIGGNSRTSMVATISPSEMTYEETFGTLTYDAFRARDIITTAQVNEDTQAARIRQLEEEVRRLKLDGHIDAGAFNVSSYEEEMAQIEAEEQQLAAALVEEQRNATSSSLALSATEAEKDSLRSERDALMREMNRSNARAQQHEQDLERLRSKQGMVEMSP